MRQLLTRHVELEPGPGRRRRLLSTVVVPARDVSGQESGER
ncbi:hypothetical protein [Rhodococcus rhodochrous]|nr:hypothetical protein [Rhodococcus rhodochrous]